MKGYKTLLRGITPVAAFALGLLIIALGTGYLSGDAFASTAGDDFNDNSKSASKWGADELYGHGVLTETHQRLEYTCSSPTSDDDMIRPWVLRRMPYNADWESQVDLFNDTSPAFGGVNSFGLKLRSPFDPDDEIFIELYAANGGLSGFRGFAAEIEQDGTMLTPAAHDTGDAGVTSAAVRMSFNSGTKVVTVYYDTDPSNGYQWVENGTFGVAGAAGVDAGFDWGLSDTDQFPLFVYGFSSNMTVTSGHIYADNFSETGGSEPPAAHDLALTNLTVSRNVTLTALHPILTKPVTVTIQNRSGHDETITTLDGLATVQVNTLGPGCPAPAVSLHQGAPNKTLPYVLKPKRKMNVVFDVVLGCANDPLKGEGHQDFGYTATVHHDAIDGHADSHAADDVCPRSVNPPSEVDPYPDGRIRDKGCGTPKPDHTFGNDVTTDVKVR
jgi:hypothetical protein